MTVFEGIGRILLIVGIVVVVLGVVFAFGRQIPFLGRLPGDILIKRDSGAFYFPIVTCILLGVGLTLITNFTLRFIGK